MNTEVFIVTVQSLFIQIHQLCMVYKEQCQQRCKDIVFWHYQSVSFFPYDLSISVKIEHHQRKIWYQDSDFYLHEKNA